MTKEEKSKFIGELSDTQRKEMNEADWVIARLLYALNRSGLNSSESDVIKATNWFTERHGTSQLIDAYVQIINEGKKPYPQNWRYNGEPR